LGEFAKKRPGTILCLKRFAKSNEGIGRVSGQQGGGGKKKKTNGGGFPPQGGKKGGPVAPKREKIRKKG